MDDSGNSREGPIEVVVTPAAGDELKLYHFVALRKAGLRVLG